MIFAKRHFWSSLFEPFWYFDTRKIDNYKDFQILIVGGNSEDENLSPKYN
jgi:hypothetical protein